MIRQSTGDDFGHRCDAPAQGFRRHGRYLRHVGRLAIQASFLLNLHSLASAAGLDVSLLPTSDPVIAKVMQLGMAREAQEIGEKFQTALGSQPEWALSFLAKAVPGQPLPYHPNFRITEDQYKLFLAAAQNLTLIEVGRVALSTARQANGDLLLITNPPLAPVNGTTVPADGKAVITPLSALPLVSSIDNQDPKAPTGRWTGTQWKTEAGAAEKKLAVKFAIGRRADFGDSIIYFDVKDNRSPPGEAYHAVLIFHPAN